MLKYTETKDAPAAIGPYSQAVSFSGFLFTSGQLPLDPSTGEMKGVNVKEQAEQVIKNIEAILKANGVGFDRVVKTLCFLSDMADFSDFNSVYSKYFTNNPARSCVAVKTLPKNALVEVEVIAALK